MGRDQLQRQRFPTRRSWTRAAPTNFRVHLGAHPPVRAPWGGVFMAGVEWPVGPSGQILGRGEGKRKRKKCVGGSGDCVQHLPFITPCKLPQLICSVWYHMDTKAQSPNCFIVCSQMVLGLRSCVVPAGTRPLCRLLSGPGGCRRAVLLPQCGPEPHGCLKVFAE